MKNKAIKMACLAGALMTAGVTSQIASAGVIANAAATSNYVWRGVTQTANGAAISGGVDYNAPFGIYVGTWVSNTAFGSQELDIYAGWAKDFGPVGIDVGAISYSYPQFHGVDNPATNNDEADTNWLEAYAGVGATVGPVDISGKLNFTQNVFGTKESAMYLEAAAEMALPGVKGATIGAHVGTYIFDVDASDAAKVGFNAARETSSGYDDYVDMNISLSYEEWSFVISDTTLENSARIKASDTNFNLDDRIKLYVTYAKDFTLLK